MAILIDPPTWPAHGTVWSHVVSDANYAELHAFARALRIPRRSFDLDHYDLPASRYDDAVALGAVPVSGKDLTRKLRDAGLRVRQAERGSVTPLRRREYLEDEWQRLGTLLEPPVDPAEWEQRGQALIARWNEPHRTYHEERHLEDVLLALDQFSVRGIQVAADTLLAAWFHDAIYAGEAGSDEAASADLAASELGALGVDPELSSRVREFILATVPGGAPAEAVASLAQLLDADLAIFAAPPHRYAEYAAAVRREYAHVADADFAAGRSRILAAYLEQPRIYRTDTARRLWEGRARENVAAEVSALLGEAGEHAIAI